jgi:hypothetical protein
MYLMYSTDEREEPKKIPKKTRSSLFNSIVWSPSQNEEFHDCLNQLANE